LVSKATSDVFGKAGLSTKGKREMLRSASMP
jgi:hypothetical protein